MGQPTKSSPAPYASRADVAELKCLLIQSLHMEEHIMATIQQVKNAIVAKADEVKARVDALQAEVQALKDSAANGGTITEAQLDEVVTAIENIFTPLVPSPVPPVVSPIDHTHPGGAASGNPVHTHSGDAQPGGDPVHTHPDGTPIPNPDLQARFAALDAGVRDIRTKLVNGTIELAEVDAIISKLALLFPPATPNNAVKVRLDALDMDVKSLRAKMVNGGVVTTAEMDVVLVNLAKLLLG